MGTKLADLPDESDGEIDANELAILNGILKVNKNNPEEYKSLRPIMIATAILAVMTLPFTDRVLELAMPAAHSWLILWGLKIVVGFVLFFIAFKL